MKLQSILLPETEFNNKDKGDALYAMELSLSLEKLNFQKLLALHKVAADAEDAQLADFIGAPPLALFLSHPFLLSRQGTLFFMWRIDVRALTLQSRAVKERMALSSLVPAPASD